MSGLDQSGNYKDIIGQLRDVAKIETGLLYSRRLMLNQAADEIQRLREALGDLLSWFSETPSEPKWLLKAGDLGADDAVKAARAALSSTEGTEG